MHLRSFLLASLFLVSTAKAGDLSASYEWKPMKIGGGGWMVGMSISAAEKGLMYSRTDVSGAYRWEPASSSWKQVVTATSMPADFVGYGRYLGVDSIVGAPSEANVAYMAMGGKPYELTPGQVFRSTNKGDTWTPTKFLEQTKVRVEANGEGRQEGERLAVDPVNSSVVYFASITDGLWSSDNAGETWTKAATIPAGKMPHGINTIVFDPHGGTIKSAQGKEKTKVLYTTVEEAGVFQSTDAGATWAKISDAAAGDAGRARDATVGPDGAYYVVYDGEKAATGGMWKRNAAGRWTDITPKDKEGGKDKSYWAISIDPFDANHIAAMIHGGKTFVSHDQGATWSFHYFKLKSPNIAWLGKQENYFLSTGQLLFDPHERGRIWYAEGFGIWWARDLETLEIEWNAASEGIEETCGNDVIAPPGGKPVAAMWDVGAFHFGDVSTYSAQRSQPGFMSTWSLDWCPKDPNFLVGVFRSHLDFVPNAKSTGFSTDGGKTWTRFAAVENKSQPAELEYGVIAVSATNPDHIVWCPSYNKLPYFTADRGATWKPCDFGPGKHETGLHSPYTALKPLCADRVEPDTFYFYTPQEGVFRSTDGGATFAKIGDPMTNRWNAILKTTPGHAKDLWFGSGLGGGLLHSTDGGATWTTAPGLTNVANVGLGKAKDAGGYPTLYAVGTASGKHGLHRSTDQGQTWDFLVDYPLGIYDAIDALDGDKDIFGQIYVCFSSTGFAWGRLK